MEQEVIIEWLRGPGLMILSIMIGVWLVRKFGRLLVSRVVRQTIKADAYSTVVDEKRREDTIISIVDATMRVILWIFAIMIILAELGVDIGPLIAGAGVAGVAIGFGAQSLVSDFVSGLFIIMENQYRVGDVVSLDGTSGVVEAITMRTTVLRDLDGNVHHVSNGNINISTNMTMEYANLHLDVGVAYDSDIEKVEEIINKVGLNMSKDKNLKDDIKEAPQFLRVNNFGDSSIDIKVLGKVKPGTQWTLMGEFRRRLKEAFDKEGIEIPFPQRVIHQNKK